MIAQDSHDHGDAQILLYSTSDFLLKLMQCQAKKNTKLSQVNNDYLNTLNLFIDRTK